MNETQRVKIWRNTKRKLCPGNCGVIVAWDTILCRKCHGKKRSDVAEKLTIAEIKATKRSYWTNYIRSLVKTTFTKCQICGYDKHVEVAHKRAVSSFTDNSTAKEINDPSNLVGLCPNHHWEFDNGLLKF